MLIIAADASADFAHLVFEFLFHHVAPDGTAFAVFMGARLETGQLFAARPDQLIQTQEFGFEFDRILFLTFHSKLRAGLA